MGVTPKSDLFIISNPWSQQFESRDVKTGTVAAKMHYEGITGPNHPLPSSFSSDGARLLLGQEIWDLRKNERRGRLGQIHDAPFSCVQWKPGEEVVASARANQLAIWDLENLRKICEIMMPSPAADVEFMPDRDRVLTAHQSGDVIMWDINSGRELIRFRADARITSMCVAPDGMMIVIGCSDGSTTLWRAAPSNEIQEWRFLDKTLTGR